MSLGYIRACCCCLGITPSSSMLLDHSILRATPNLPVDVSWIIIVKPSNAESINKQVSKARWSLSRAYRGKSLSSETWTAQLSRSVASKVAT